MHSQNSIQTRHLQFLRSAILGRLMFLETTNYGLEIQIGEKMNVKQSLQSTRNHSEKSIAFLQHVSKQSTITATRFMPIAMAVFMLLF